ncbi:MAG: hypothetical protein OXC03_01085 [Flavobacteriaceae bacterium]|nr:hypothetical protein [Flavobacteriaceae bacterium]
MDIFCQNIKDIGMLANVKPDSEGADFMNGFFKRNRNAFMCGTVKTFRVQKECPQQLHL